MNGRVTCMTNGSIITGVGEIRSQKQKDRIMCIIFHVYNSIIAPVLRYRPGPSSVKLQDSIVLNFWDLTATPVFLHYNKIFFWLLCIGIIIAPISHYHLDI